MHKLHRSALIALLICGGAAGTPATATDFADFLVEQTLTPNNAANWDTPNASSTIFSWGAADTGNNSVRTLTYTGTQQYRLSNVTIASTVLNSYDASGFNSNYSSAWFTLLSDLKTDVTVTQSGTVSAPQQVSLSTVNDTYITPTAVSATSTLANITNRTVTAGTKFDFRFYEDTVNLTNLPDAVYTQPVTVTFKATAINPTLTITPNPLVFNAARAGSGTASTLSTALSNTGDLDSVWSGTAQGASGAPFSGGNQAVSIKQGATPQSVGYGFTALDSLGGANTAVVSSGTAVMKANAGSGADQTLNLQGTTVGPVFALSGTGVGTGTIDFGKVLITKSGTQAHTPNSLAVTNAFSDPGSLYNDTLTGLTIRTVTRSGTDAASFAGAPTTAGVIPDASPGNSNTRNFLMTFNPTTGVAGTGQL